jgi:hypothetical protein
VLFEFKNEIFSGSLAARAAWLQPCGTFAIEVEAETG